MNAQTAILAFSVVVALLAAVSAARSSKAAEISAERQRETHDLSAFREFILREYIEREFKATEAPEINDESVTLLREAKTIAENECERDPNAWEKSSQVSNLGAWQNKVAFETAWALNNLGAAALTGNLPLRMLLAIASDQIIDDWLLCRTWVNSYRESQNVTLKQETTYVPDIHYHRRHAEWLVLVAVAWLSRHWSYPNCSIVAEHYGGIQNLLVRLRELSSVDLVLIPESVRREIMSLTGIEIV